MEEVKKQKYRSNNQITSQLQEIRGQALASALYRLINYFPPMILRVMELGDTAIVGETWCSDSEGMLSESRSVSGIDDSD